MNAEKFSEKKKDVAATHRRSTPTSTCKDTGVCFVLAIIAISGDPPRPDAQSISCTLFLNLPQQLYSFRSTDCELVVELIAAT
jgi:hypothetical protein